MPKLITSIEELKQIAEGRDIGVFIYLGGARSSKSICYNKHNNTFDVFHYIDSTDDYGLTEDQLTTHTNIAAAIEMKTLYQDD